MGNNQDICNSQGEKLNLYVETAYLAEKFCMWKMIDLPGG
jgi:hypothetical protein